MNRSQSKFHNQHAEQPHAEDWCPGIKRNTEAGAVILNIAFAQDDDGGVGQNEGKHDDGRCDGDQLFQRQQLRGDHDRSGDKKCRQRHFPLSIGIAEEAGNQGVTPHCIGKACRRHYSRVGCSDECHHRTKGDDGKAGSAVILPCGIRKRCQRTCKLSGLQYTDSDNQSQDIDECDGNDRTDHPEGKVAFGIGLKLPGGNSEELESAAKEMCLVTKTEMIDVNTLMKSSRLPVVLGKCRELLSDGKPFAEIVRVTKTMMEGTDATGVLRQIALLATVVWSSDRAKLEGSIPTLISIGTRDAFDAAMVIEKFVNEKGQ